MLAVVGMAHVLEGKCSEWKILGNLKCSELFAVCFDVA